MSGDFFVGALVGSLETMFISCGTRHPQIQRARSPQRRRFVLKAPEEEQMMEKRKFVVKAPEQNKRSISLEPPTSSHKEGKRNPTCEPTISLNLDVPKNKTSTDEQSIQ
ncbi:hypothetical protein M3Y94_01010000 [Aphelenchoides besseyi]|nr:hypothetical protein M3Y94_01010000 [Aphelenchoides besseyi]